MPAFIVWFLGGLASLLQGLVPRIMFALGIGFATFTGFSAALTTLKTYVLTQLTGLPAVIVQVLALCKTDVGLTMVMAAHTAVIATRLTEGALTRVTMKGSL